MKLGSPFPEKKARIEIIPLIDIMFFLLASFMMASLSMIHMQSIKMNLPSAVMASPDFSTSLFNISVDKVGDIYIEQKLMNVVDLRSFLSNKFRINTNITVYISGAKEATHGSVIRVLDIVRQEGIQKVSFAISSKPQKE